jgi:anti-sigma factor RsiW
MQRLSEIDITNYVLNELEPSERLFVESLMLGCEKSREDALVMMEMARLLEEGMDRELAAPQFELDPFRRETIFAYKAGSIWQTLRNAGATVAALAACVAFSVTAPSLSRLALDREKTQSQPGAYAGLSIDGSAGSDVLDPGAFPSFADDSVEDGAGNQVSEDLPTRVLLPTGAVNFVEMPLPSLGADSN